MIGIGEQYHKDDFYDKSGFRKNARLHQSKYRAEILNVDFDEYGNRLTDEDGRKGLNFFNGFSVFEEVKRRYPDFKKPLYCDMLRSEHIPFNLFIPLKYNLDYCRDVFNEFLSKTIKNIYRIEIEHAPKRKENYLNDNTSFDAYFEYTHTDNSKGILGIEVKYTEHEYSLKKGSKEERFIKDKKSPYHTVTAASKLYKSGTIDFLIKDRFRQVWRNQMLGESILLKDNNKFNHFTSLTFFPSDNTHFSEVSKEYVSFLKKKDNIFCPVTFENYIELLNKYFTNTKYIEWIDYLSDRYIITNTKN